MNVVFRPKFRAHQDRKIHEPAMVLPMNSANVGIVIQSAKDRLRQNKNCLESLLANTDYPYRLIWSHVTHDPVVTGYLLNCFHDGKIQHLFLHRPEDDWTAMGCQNACAKVFSVDFSILGPHPPEWLILSTDDMEFQPGWLTHAMKTAEAFADVPNIGVWSIYRPPEHVWIPPAMKRGDYEILFYKSLAVRCVMIKLALWMEMGGWNMTVAYSADWRFIADLERRGLKMVVIGGEKVLHRDFGYLPAHGIRHADEICGDEKALAMFGGYRGAPGTTWPEELSRPSV